MRAADLKRAQSLVAQRDSIQAMAGRIAAGERLRFILGEGDKASEIVVADSYWREIAGALRFALEQRVQHFADELAELGIDG